MIPNSVITISDSAFYKCTSLVSAIIGNNVATINDHAFRECTSLASVIIPNSVTTMGREVFHNCASLTSAIIGNNVPSIGDHAFRGCTSLTSIEIPCSVTAVGDSAFLGCNSLVNIALPNAKFAKIFRDIQIKRTIYVSVDNIDSFAFAKYFAITSLVIPDYVTYVAAKAFDGWIKCQTIYVNKANSKNFDKKWDKGCSAKIVYR
jgi:acyl-[acyl carrier protein]--UDP-N-acetylglucosamine O-acyltransferase